MIRLNIVVEGQTEETFVRDVLYPDLMPLGVACSARCVQTGRKRATVFRGGVLSYAKLKRDLVLWMRQDQNPEAYFSSMVDLYRLPRDFPGYAEASRIIDVHERVAALEGNFREDVGHGLGRFVPYIQTHEFEALLFSKPDVFALRFPNREREMDRLRDVRAECPSPEHIDDVNPPSKRILSVFPDYDKVGDGPVLACEIGLARIRQECRHFDDWFRKLETLGQ